MSWIKPRGKKGIFAYYWFDGKTTRSKSIHTADIDRAKEKKRIFDSQLEQRAPITDKSLWKEFVPEYLRFAETKKSKGTVEKEKHIIKKFESIANPLRLSSVNSQQIESWQAKVSQETSKANANAHYRHLKAMFSKAVEWQYIPQSPFRHVKQIKMEKRFPRFLNKKEINALFKAAKEDRSDAERLTAFYLYTGMRASELIGLKWQDIDLKQGWVRVFGKGQKERVIPIFDKLKPYLKRSGTGYVFGGETPLSRFTIADIFERLYKKAEIEGANIHCLRHTFASHAVMSGIDLATLKEILGHANIGTTMIYSHLSKGHIQSAIQKLRL